MTPAPNPYAAPAARSGQPVGPGLEGQSYVPLQWRTVVATISVCGMTLVDATMRTAQLTRGDESSGAGAADLVSTVLIGLSGLGVIVLSMCSWVFVPVWMHRASSNLRGLGRYGMEFTPAGCAGWFFVPIANIWKPAQAMSELWKASDPQADQGAWFASAGTPLVGVWWVTWLVSGVVSWGSLLSKSDPSMSAAIGLWSCAFRAVAAVALVLLMYRIASRQERAATQHTA
jgi:hypothetical protein